MAEYVIRPHLEFVEQSDGSWVAMGRELPIFVGAPTREELEDLLERLEPTVRDFVTAMGDGDALKYIEERGIPWEPDQAQGEYRIRMSA